MSLISCPDCNREISAKAMECPSCGCPAEHLQALPPCQTCGRNISINADKCPQCGAINPGKGKSLNWLQHVIGGLLFIIALIIIFRFMPSSFMNGLTK